MTYLESLNHVYDTDRGLMKDLKKELDSETILDFELTGLIHQGQEIDRQNSWKITEEAKELHYVANLETMYKPSLFDRFQGFINRLLLDKKMINA